MRKFIFLSLFFSVISVQTMGMDSKESSGDEGEKSIERLEKVSLSIQSDLNSLKESVGLGGQSPLESDETYTDATTSEEENMVIPQIPTLPLVKSSDDLVGLGEAEEDFNQLRDAFVQEENQHESLAKFLLNKGRVEHDDGLLAACTKKMQTNELFKKVLSSAAGSKGFVKKRSRVDNSDLLSLVDLLKNTSIEHLQKEQRKSEERIGQQEKSLNTRKKTIYSLTATNFVSGVFALITVANFGLGLYNKFSGGGGSSGGCDTD